MLGILGYSQAMIWLDLILFNHDLCVSSFRMRREYFSLNVGNNVGVIFDVNALAYVNIQEYIFQKIFRFSVIPHELRNSF